MATLHGGGKCPEVDVMYVQKAVLCINKIVDVGWLVSATLCYTSSLSAWFIKPPPRSDSANSDYLFEAEVQNSTPHCISLCRPATRVKNVSHAGEVYIPLLQIETFQNP
jgi:hypothetical protein